MFQHIEPTLHQFVFSDIGRRLPQALDDLSLGDTMLFALNNQQRPKFAISISVNERGLSQAELLRKTLAA